jgi:chromate transport protein ChrA
MMYGLHCVVLVAILFAAVWSLAASMNDIIDGIVDMGLSLYAFVKLIFAFTGPISPAIAGSSIAVSMWALLMNEKLYRENLLTFKFNTFSGGMHFVCTPVTIIFFVNHVVQTAQDFTVVKTMLALGMFVQLIAGQVIFDYRRKMNKRNKSKPIDG